MTLSLRKYPLHYIAGNFVIFCNLQLCCPFSCRTSLNLSSQNIRSCKCIGNRDIPCYASTMLPRNQRRPIWSSQGCNSIRLPDRHSQTSRFLLCLNLGSMKRSPDNIIEEAVPCATTQTLLAREIVQPQPVHSHATNTVVSDALQGAPNRTPTAVRTSSFSRKAHSSRMESRGANLQHEERKLPGFELCPGSSHRAIANHHCRHQFTIWES